MAFNGFGVFTRIMNWVNDKNAAIPITASRMDTDSDDFAAAFNLCLTRDGQGVPSANLPMNGFKHTGASAATAATDYALASQAQTSSLGFVAAGGTGDAISGTYSPVITALTDGMQLGLRAGAANTTTTPTFSPNALTAHTITKLGGGALAAGDIFGAGHELILRYNLANTRWELLNPASGFGDVAPASTGSANAYVLTLSPVPAALLTGFLYRFTSNFANTGSATLNINSLGAKTIKKNGATNLVANDIANGQAVALVYDGTNFQMVSPVSTLLSGAGGNLTGALNMAKGAAVASATSCDIWTPADGNLIHITGTTTITSFATAPQAGAWRHIVFDGVLTLTHGASAIVLPGGVNITTAAGDEAWVFADTTTKHLVVYQKASGRAVVETTYPITVSYTSADTAVTTGAANSFTHGLGTTPKIVGVYLVCQTGEQGYTAGDVVQCTVGLRSGAGLGTGLVVTSTTIVMYPQTNPFAYVHKSTFADVFLTPANWKWRVIAYA